MLFFYLLKSRRLACLTVCWFGKLLLVFIWLIVDIILLFIINNLKPVVKILMRKDIFHLYMSSKSNFTSHYPLLLFGRYACWCAQDRSKAIDWKIQETSKTQFSRELRNMHQLLSMFANYGSSWYVKWILKINVIYFKGIYRKTNNRTRYHGN